MIDSLPAKPVVRNVAGLETVARLILHYRALSAREDARLQRQIDSVREKAQHRFLVPVEDEPQLISERLAALESAAAKFVASKPGRKALFNRGTKTAELPSCIVSLRDEASRLDFQPGESRPTVVEKLSTPSGLHGKIAELLAALGLTGWIKLKPELDFSGIKEAVKEGRLALTELPARGLKWDQHPVTVNVEPRQ